jgi:HAD superfamily hydrolase (TIGR01509 family)
LKRPIAALLDFDGVLVDSEPTWDAADRRLVESWGATFRPEVKRLVMGRKQDDSTRILLAEHGLAASPERIVEARRLREAWMREAYATTIPSIDGARELLEGLAGRGIPTAIATATPADLVRVALERFGFAKAVRVLATAEEVPNGKPAPDVFLLAAARLGVTPERAAVLEDSEAGIRAARAAGCLAVWLQNPHAPAAREVADVVVQRPSDLLVRLGEQAS